MVLVLASTRVLFLQQCCTLPDPMSHQGQGCAECQMPILTGPAATMLPCPAHTPPCQAAWHGGAQPAGGVRGGARPAAEPGAAAQRGRHQLAAASRAAWAPPRVRALPGGAA